MSTKILMVCLGNICRSPLAEGILKEKVDTDSVLVDSAGTANYHIGKQPDPRSIAVAKKHGIDISMQRCRQFTAEDFKRFDHIFAMDKDNYANIIALAQDDHEKQKVKLLLHQLPTEDQEVPDPYYGGDDGFEHVYQLIDMACEQLAEELNLKHTV